MGVLRDAPTVEESLSDLLQCRVRDPCQRRGRGERILPGTIRILRKDLIREGTGSVFERMLIRRIGLDYLATPQDERVRAPTPGEQRNLELAKFYDQ